MTKKYVKLTLDEGIDKKEYRIGLMVFKPEKEDEHSFECSTDCIEQYYTTLKKPPLLEDMIKTFDALSSKLKELR